MPNFDSQSILLAILAVVTLAIVGQTILLLAIFVTIRKTARTIKEDVEDLHSEISPILHNARELFIRVAPRLEDTAADLAAMAHGLRNQTADIQASAADVLEKVRHQSARIDGMITRVFNAVDHATGFVTETVAKPVRQLSGILASAKAIIETLRNAAPAQAPAQRPPAAAPEVDEKDMFV